MFLIIIVTTKGYPRKLGPKGAKAKPVETLVHLPCPYVRFEEIPKAPGCRFGVFFKQAGRPRPTSPWILAINTKAPFLPWTCNKMSKRIGTTPVTHFQGLTHSLFEADEQKGFGGSTWLVSRETRSDLAMHLRICRLQAVLFFFGEKPNSAQTMPVRKDGNDGPQLHAAKRRARSPKSSARQPVNWRKLYEIVNFHPLTFRIPLAVAPKNRYQNGTLVSGNMDQNLRNPSCLCRRPLPPTWAPLPPPGQPSACNALSWEPPGCREQSRSCSPGTWRTQTVWVFTFVVFPPFSLFSLFFP